MKKVFVCLLAMLLLVSLAACGETVETPQITIGTQPPQESTAPQNATDPQDPTEPDRTAEVFAFVYEGVELCPGEAFDASKLPEAASVYQVPSCALEGTDNVYNYSAFEVTAFDDGKNEYVYSVYFLDPNLKTPEGLALGDPASLVQELYGQEFTAQGTATVYTRGKTQLVLIIQNEAVVSIEYRLIVE